MPKTVARTKNKEGQHASCSILPLPRGMPYFINAWRL